MADDEEMEDYSGCCRFCGKLMEEGERKVKKEKVSDLVKKIFDVTYAHDAGWMPNCVHYLCKKKLEYSQQKKGRIAPEMFIFLPPTPRCRRCGQRAGHTAASCPESSSKRKNLMDCASRHYANRRIKPFEDVVDEYCTEKGEDNVDLLKYTLQKELFDQGKRKEAMFVGKLSSGMDTPTDPLTPRTTLARVVTSKRSFNQYEDDFRFFKQKNKQVFSGPMATDIERWKINHKAVPFTLTD